MKDGPRPTRVPTPPPCARTLFTSQVVVQEDKRWGEKEKDLLYKVRA